jgi:hypothetical protein
LVKAGQKLGELFDSWNAALLVLIGAILPQKVSRVTLKQWFELVSVILETLISFIQFAAPMEALLEMY